MQSVDKTQLSVPRSKPEFSNPISSLAGSLKLGHFTSPPMTNGCPMRVLLEGRNDDQNVVCLRYVSPLCYCLWVYVLGRVYSTFSNRSALKKSGSQLASERTFTLKPFEGQSKATHQDMTCMMFYQNMELLFSLGCVPFVLH